MIKANNNFTVPDICDKFLDEIIIGKTFLNSYGGVDRFCGEISTAECVHSNSVVKEMVQENGLGKVLFINHTGDDLCSMVGDQIVKEAYKNNWSGIFVNGFIRDIEIIKQISIGVYAKNAYPKKTDKSIGIGKKDSRFLINDTEINPGEWLYVDLNGWVIAKKELRL